MRPISQTTTQNLSQRQWDDATLYASLELSQATWVAAYAGLVPTPWRSGTILLGIKLSLRSSIDGMARPAWIDSTTWIIYQRLKEAKAQLVSADDKARYEIRKRLAQEFRRRIDHVTLYDDGTITMRIRTRRGLGAVDIRYAGEGVRNINVIGQDGTVLTSFDLVSMAALFEPIETQAA